MKFRRWFSPLASAAVITLLGGLTAFAVEGVVEQAPAALVAQEDQEELEGEDNDDLVFDLEVDTGGDDVDSNGEGRPEDAPDNHGQTVSEFARTTTLEGCEKGHAISAVARGADPADPQASDLYKPCKSEEQTGDLESGTDVETSTSGHGHAKGKGNGHAKGKGNGHANAETARANHGGPGR